MTAAALPPARAGGLLINGLGAAQLCSWGSLYYSFPLVAQAMGDELGWPKTALYGAATLGLALAGLAAYPVGRAIDRGHGRAVMAGGSVLAGALLLLWASADSMPLFYLAAAGIGATQAALLYDPAFAVVARRVGPAHARAGITALTMWGGFASTVFVPLVQVLISGLGWREALVVLGLVNLTVCAGLNFAAIDSRRDAVPPGALGGRPVPHALGPILRRPVFWSLAAAFTAYSVMFSGFSFHLYPMLVERGFDVATVVTAMAIIGPAQVAGRLAIWVAAPRAPVRIVGAVVVAVFPLCFIALELVPPDFLGVALIAVVFGAANGIMTIVKGLAVPEMLTRQAYGAVNGALATPSMVARALAPAGMAMLWAASGSYDTVLLAVLAGAAVLAAGFWTAAILSRHGLAEGE